ncbi:MAG TPA: amino acid adenylation domain-containing protein [Ktedonobacteraceae bacterium]|nr:amino acid adenylation domain-containing protein [Ktedonobacteraceae bacterium]
MLPSVQAAHDEKLSSGTANRIERPVKSAMLPEHSEKVSRRTAIELLQFLREMDVKVWVDGERLRCNAPQGVLTPALRTELAEKKAELLVLLRKGASQAHLTVEPIVPVQRDKPIPQSFAQQQLWLLDQLAPESRAYYTSFGVRLRGSLLVGVLERCLNEVVRRHEILRTTFEIEGDEPTQVIHPPYAVDLPWIDLSPLSSAEQEEQISFLFKQLAHSPYNLQQGPLLRLIVLQLHSDEYLLLLAMHHIIADGWSLEIFIQEMSLLYEAFVSGKPSPLPDLSIQYADFAAWQRQWMQKDYYASLLEYWRQHLADAPPLLMLPLDRPRPPVQTQAGADLLLSFSPSLTRSLKAFSQREGVTLFMVLLAAFQTLLARLSGQEDILIGTIIANRPQKELEKLIGLFINTQVLRTNLSGNPSFREMLQRVRQTALAAYTHQDLPFEKLVEELHPERNLSYHPVFQVLFDFHNIPRKHLKLPGIELEPIYVKRGVASAFDMQLVIEDDEESLSGQIVYHPDLFNASTITRIARHFQELLQQIVDHPDQRIWNLPLVSASERKELLVDWNATQTAFPLDLCFSQQFEKQAAMTPDAVAVVCNHEYLTYEMLNARANQLAHHLRQLGVYPEQIVALFAPRSIPFLISMLALWKVGATYLPLDLQFPDKYIAQVLVESGVSLVLTSGECLPDLDRVSALLPEGFDLRFELFDDLSLNTQPTSNFATNVTPQHLAYIIYTSGSTGIPKGVMIEQRGMLNHIYAKIQELSLSSSDCVAQTASQSFDISIWQFLAVLLVGGCVHIFPDEVSHDPPALLRELERGSVTNLEVVPPLLSVLLEYAPVAQRGLSDLRWMILTGEALPPELCRRWFMSYQHVPLLNAYGPTECSDDVAHHPITEGFVKEVTHTPIGKPIANTQLYVLDRHLEPVPIGVIGELYVGGRGVGRGYLNDAWRTAEAFIPDGFLQQEGARLYKTGDLARWLEDGTLEYLRRSDQQIKIHGFRIELGAVEAILQQHPALRDCIVLAQENRAGEKYLVAYGIPSQLAPSPYDLKTYLQERLPDYMVPSYFLFLDAWPLTQSGKIDRHALPHPLETGQQTPHVEYVPPRDTLEFQLVQIWEEILEQHPIGVRDDFFELGGHSLLAVQLLLRLEKRLGRTLPLASLFQGKTIELMASLLRQQAAPMPPSPLVEIQRSAALRPFFCVHPAGGSALCYYQLAQALGPEQPFYGLQSPSLEDKDVPFISLEQIAARYIDALREVQPEGPYLLGGWSFGGCLAFEMARQLSQQQQQVALLALIDSWAPVPEQFPPPDDAELLKGFIQDLLLLPVAKEEFPSHFTSQQVTDDSFSALFEWARGMGTLPPDITMEQLQRFFLIFKAHISAWANYIPEPASVCATLFNARASSPVDTSHSTHGWEKLALGGVEPHAVPGDHFSIVSQPGALARELKSCLNAAYQRIDAPRSKTSLKK